jgi:alkaline phosphatase D
LVIGFLNLRSSAAEAATRLRFRHGVASGDPARDSVVLWTRVSGIAGRSVRVRWKVALDKNMRRIVRKGSVDTGPERDYTVKVYAPGLPAGSRLYYQFRAAGTESPVGATRTLPADAPDAVRFAVVSCSSYPSGFFHAYREISRRDDLDAVLHLGDYIYEYGLGGFGTSTARDLNRVPAPEGEALTLDDYRLRHAQYKADPDSQAMHASLPLIAIWDDHEVANDAWRDGAENHGDGDGDWSRRQNAAFQAYLEWMPLRVEHEGAATRIYRDFQYGDLVSLSMLDTRFAGRDRPPFLKPDMDRRAIRSVLDEPKRQLLGDTQRKWLRGTLRQACQSTWQVVGQQVLVSEMVSPDLEPLIDWEAEAAIDPDFLRYNVLMSKKNVPVLVDTWNGYGAEREALLAMLEACPNPVVLSGDLHTSMAGNLVPAGGDTPVAVEFMGPSVTSPGFSDSVPESRPGAMQDAIVGLNEHLVFMETQRRGWLCMTFTSEDCVGEWHLLDTVHAENYEASIGQRLAVRAGRVFEGLYPA